MISSLHGLEIQHSWLLTKGLLNRFSAGLIDMDGILDIYERAVRRLGQRRTMTRLDPSVRMRHGALPAFAEVGYESKRSSTASR